MIPRSPSRQNGRKERLVSKTPVFIAETKDFGIEVDRQARRGVRSEVERGREERVAFGTVTLASDRSDGPRAPRAPSISRPAVILP
jgi:hypothetical protein